MSKSFRAVTYAAPALALVVPPAVLHAALASAAGTLFEAAPFVLAAASLRGPGTRFVASLAGCGCTAQPGVAALSLPAVALCAVTFGPAVAAARFVAGLAIAGLLHAPGPARRAGLEASAAVAQRPAPAEAGDGDGLARLAGLAAPAFAFGLVAAFVQAGAVRLPAWPAPAAAVALFAAGALAATLSPCATAAIALAAMLRHVAPPAAAGLLACAGFVPRVRVRAQADGRPRAGAFAYATLALLLGTVAVRGGAGFVNPRLVPLLLAAAAGAVALAVRRTPTRAGGPLVPAALLGALALGSPPPATIGATASLDGAYPGRRVAFTGRALRTAAGPALVRYAIACCRADATAIVLPLDRVYGTGWAEATGTLVAGTAGLTLRVERWQPRAPPADPFVYR